MTVFLILLSGVAIGALFTYLLLRPKYVSLEAHLRNLENECNEKTRKIEEIDSQFLQVLEGKAKAEQEAKKVPELEKEIESLRIENTELKTRIAEIQKELEADKEKIQWKEETALRMREAFQALASQVLQSNSEEFLKHARLQLETILGQIRGDLSTQRVELRNLVEPLESTLKALDNEIRDLERKREGAYQGLSEQLRQLAETHYQLQKTTLNLVQALKSPTVRGRWGEYQLRRVVELAGMLQHVDFEEQSGTDRGRPDMIIYLPNMGILPVDAKAPMQAYLEALESNDEHTRMVKLSEHAKAIRERIRELSQKQYWQQFGRTPELVIMFVPNEACLTSAFEREPDLLEFAIERRVLPASPISFLGLLWAIAHGWQQHQIAENALQIARQGKELYERLNKFIGDIHKAGTALQTVVKSYNEAIGSFEERLLPSVKRFKDLCGVTEELKSPRLIDYQVRLPKGPQREEESS